jgi:hypothetical protein
MMYINPALVVQLNATYGSPNWAVSANNATLTYSGTAVDLSFLKPDFFGDGFNLAIAGTLGQATIVQAILDKNATQVGFSKTGASTLADVQMTLVPNVPKVVGVTVPF